jgi:hypothetical protein
MSKKVAAGILTLAAVALLFFATSASATNAYIEGFVDWPDGSNPGAGVYVYIHNNTTGANGSTTTNSYGYWHASAPAFNNYSIHATFGVGCFLYYSDTITGDVISSPQRWPNLYLSHSSRICSSPLVGLFSRATLPSTP